MRSKLLLLGCAGLVCHPSFAGAKELSVTTSQSVDKAAVPEGKSWHCAKPSRGAGFIPICGRTTVECEEAVKTFAAPSKIDAAQVLPCQPRRQAWVVTSTDTSAKGKQRTSYAVVDRKSCRELAKRLRSGRADKATSSRAISKCARTGASKAVSLDSRLGEFSIHGFDTYWCAALAKKKGQRFKQRCFRQANTCDRHKRGYPEKCVAVNAPYALAAESKRWGELYVFATKQICRDERARMISIELPTQCGQLGPRLLGPWSPPKAPVQRSALAPGSDWHCVVRGTLIGKCYRSLSRCRIRGAGKGGSCVRQSKAAAFTFGAPAHGGVAFVDRATCETRLRRHMHFKKREKHSGCELVGVSQRAPVTEAVQDQHGFGKQAYAWVCGTETHWRSKKPRSTCRAVNRKNFARAMRDFCARLKRRVPGTPCGPVDMVHVYTEGRDARSFATLKDCQVDQNESLHGGSLPGREVPQTACTAVDVRRSVPTVQTASAYDPAADRRLAAPLKGLRWTAQGYAAGKAVQIDYSVRVDDWCRVQVTKRRPDQRRTVTTPMRMRTITATAKGKRSVVIKTTDKRAEQSSKLDSAIAASAMPWSTVTLLFRTRSKRDGALNALTAATRLCSNGWSR